MHSHALKQNMSINGQPPRKNSEAVGEEASFFVVTLQCATDDRKAARGAM